MEQRHQRGTAVCPSFNYSLGTQPVPACSNKVHFKAAAHYTEKTIFFPSLPLFLNHFPGREKTTSPARFEGNIIPAVEDSGVTGTVCYGMDCKLLL